MENKTLRVLELFAGIGACSKALEKLNIPHEIVDAVEIDKYAIKSFNAVHGTNFEPQDITKWDKDIDVDLIMHGSPCQDFSVAGKQAGGDEGSGTRSSLMYETLRIVDKLHPKFVIWENVKNLLSQKHKHNFDAYLDVMKTLGYISSYQVLNAKNYGIPQNRERVFTVSIREDIWDKYYNDFNTFEFPEPFPLERKLKDMLEPDVDEKYFISDNMMNYFMGVNQKPSKFPRKERFLANINRKDQDTANSITTNAGQRPTDNFIKVRTANKQGYDLATEGDSVDLQYPSSTTRRGRVGHEVAKTIMTGDGMGVVVKSDSIQRVDIPQTVKVRKYDVDIEKLRKTLRENKCYSNKDIATILEQPITKVEHWFRTDGSFSIPDAEIWQKLKALLHIETDEFDKSIMEFEEREGVYEKSNRCYMDTGIAPTLTNTSADEKVIVTPTGIVVDKSVKPSVAKNFERDKEAIATTDKEIYNCECDSQWQDNKVGIQVSPSLRAGNNSTYGLTKSFRIRKLTPKECWRLMGFEDSDFEKAEKVNSNAQLYKQAGNSIVVDVIEAILGRLLCQ